MLGAEEQGRGEFEGVWCHGDWGFETAVRWVELCHRHPWQRGCDQQACKMVSRLPAACRPAQLSSALHPQQLQKSSTRTR